ncbi:anoctamin-8-like [Mya arenaria]|uniref:anoctamin-8-like n=1 Tax=Mya arenaria TaxID=6604 RepID=UPI0022E0107F|nr:anoctamin-8-like [Mya arenaria]
MSDLRHRISLSLLQKRCRNLNTSRLVASSRVLHNSIPTQNCDVIMTLPATTDDSTLMWLLARLRSRLPELHVHVRHWKNTGVYAFYMTAEYEDLLRMCEEEGLCKPLKAEYGGGQKEFLFEDRGCYEGVEDEGHFISSEERQSLVYQILLNLRALEGEELDGIRFLEGQSIVPVLQSKKVVSQVFPLHHRRDLLKLRKTWVQSFGPQPLDGVCSYFGVKIAMYFAYLGHYTKLLLAPTILGIIVWFVQSTNQVLEDVCFIGFGLFNVLWATMYCEAWRRKNAELAYRWGTLDRKSELLQDPRPLYTGHLVTSRVTGRPERHYPAWRRYLFFYFVSVPVIAMCLLIVFCIMLMIFELQEWVNGLVKSDILPSFCLHVPKVLLAICIGILDEIYKKIASWLNDKENYRMEETYENNLIIKLVLFQFVNSFLSLFYIAFYLRDMDRLRDQLATLMITRQVIGNLREAVLPYFLWKAKLMKVGYDITGHMSPNTIEKESMSVNERSGCADEADTEASGCKGEGHTKMAADRDSTSQLVLTQAQVESTMKKYEDTFDDYLEMFIQYGYVILFSSAFPLAALCAFLNNVIEIRSDAFKLCVYHQRPFGRRVHNIGIWQNAIVVMGVVAVMVNCALIGVSGQLDRMVPGMDTTSIIIVIVVLEHVILVLKMCMTYAIPAQPHWIKEEMAHLEFQRRQALKRMETQISPPLVNVSRSPTKSPSSSPSSDPFTLHRPQIPVRHHDSLLRKLGGTADKVSDSKEHGRHFIAKEPKENINLKSCNEPKYFYYQKDNEFTDEVSVGFKNDGINQRNISEEHSPHREGSLPPSSLKSWLHDSNDSSQEITDFRQTDPHDPQCTVGDSKVRHKVTFKVPSVDTSGEDYGHTSGLRGAGHGSTSAIPSIQTVRAGQHLTDEEAIIATRQRILQSARQRHGGSSDLQKKS